jgi:hypothetical protein
VKLVIHRSDAPPLTIESDRVFVTRGLDHFRLTEQEEGLLVRLEEHDNGLALNLAVFPTGGNGVRLKGGLR